MTMTPVPGLASATVAEDTTLMAHTLVPEAPACAMCHTLALPLGDADIAAGATWQCQRCGQKWDAARLRTVSAYQRWDRERAASYAVPA